MSKLLITLFSLFFIAACTPSQATRGNLLTEDRLAYIKVEESTRDEVVEYIGSPTNIAPFDPNTWYYIGQMTEKQGFLDREIVDQQVFVARFNEEGTLIQFENMETANLDIPIVTRETPTHGNDMTVFQQLIGNLGRFNPASLGGGQNDGFGNVPGDRR